MGVLEGAVLEFRRIVEREGLLNERVVIKMRPLSPREAIGEPKRKDFPILKGKEVLVEANFLGSKGQAFTDEPSDFEGSILDVLSLDLNSSRNRAVVVASLNAVLRHLKIVMNTVHCKNSEPEECGKEMANRFFKRWGEDMTVGLVGLQPAIASSLIGRFGKEHVQIADLDEDNIGKYFEGVEILDGRRYALDVVANNFLALITGSSVVNGTIDELIRISKMDNKNRIVIFYGTTIAGVSYLMNLNRLCFKSHDD